MTPVTKESCEKQSYEKRKGRKKQIKDKRTSNKSNKSKKQKTMRGDITASKQYAFLRALVFSSFSPFLPLPLVPSSFSFLF